MKKRWRIVATGACSLAVLVMWGPTTAMAGSDVVHAADVYVEEKMCLGSESEVTGGPCDINANTSPLHVLRDAGGNETLVHLENSGPTKLVLENTDVGSPATAVEWNINNDPSGEIRISDAGDPDIEFLLDRAGNVTISGSLTSSSRALPDYVFADDYPLIPIGALAVFVRENKHLPNVPSDAEVARSGRLDMSAMQLRLLEKIEELTLYALDQQGRIEQQEVLVDDLVARLAALEPASLAD